MADNYIIPLNKAPLSGQNTVVNEKAYNSSGVYFGNKTKPLASIKKTDNTGSHVKAVIRHTNDNPVFASSGLTVPIANNNIDANLLSVINAQERTAKTRVEIGEHLELVIQAHPLQSIAVNFVSILTSGAGYTKFENADNVQIINQHAPSHTTYTRTIVADKYGIAKIKMTRCDENGAQVAGDVPFTAIKISQFFYVGAASVDIYENTIHPLTVEDGTLHSVILNPNGDTADLVNLPDGSRGFVMPPASQVAGVTTGGSFHLVAYDSGQAVYSHVQTKLLENSEECSVILDEGYTHTAGINVDNKGATGITYRTKSLNGYDVFIGGDGVIYIDCPSSVESESISVKAIGTGAYELQTWNRQSLNLYEITLEQPDAVVDYNSATRAGEVLSNKTLVGSVLDSLNNEVGSLMIKTNSAGEFVDEQGNKTSTVKFNSYQLLQDQTVTVVVKDDDVAHINEYEAKITNVV